MARIFISSVLSVLGVIDLVWGYFFGTPLIPGISDWLQSKGYNTTMTHLILVLIFFLFGLLVLKFSKPRTWLKIKPLPRLQTIGNQIECLIEVENENLNEPAENVKVKLLKIEPTPKHAASKTDLPLRFPIQLESKNQNPTIINPKDSIQYLLFKIKQTLTEIECEVVGTDIQLNTFTHSYWVNNPEVIEYRISISASASHRTRIKKRFSLKFPMVWSEIPFTLTEI